MTITREEMLDLFCQVLDLKERKKKLYHVALVGCADQVGKETFRFLFDAEDSQLNELQKVYDDLKRGAQWGEACRYIEPQAGDARALFQRLAQERQESSRCEDDLSALATGMELEEASIKFFQDKLAQASDPAQKKFLERMVSEEREHHRVLADLQFYYTDPQAWFMEKSKARLDGAGAGT